MRSLIGKIGCWLAYFLLPFIYIEREFYILMMRKELKNRGAWFWVFKDAVFCTTYQINSIKEGKGI